MTRIARRTLAGLAAAGALLATTATAATAAQPAATATPPSCLTVEEGYQNNPWFPHRAADVTNNCAEAHSVVPTWVSGHATEGCQTIQPGETVRYTNVAVETDYVGLSFC